jgi:hypothetical protein
MITQPELTIGLNEIALCVLSTAIILYFILPKFFNKKNIILQTSSSDEDS